MQGETVAVIGAGIAGLATSWFLRDHFQVSLFEREAILGGHARTLEVRDPEGRIGIDIGFIVFNPRNYPLLSRLFDTLGVATQETDMSFGYSVHPRGLEYAGTSVATLFAQRKNLLRPRFLRMLADILRFNRIAKRHLLMPDDPAESLGGFLHRHGFGKGFVQDYILPMGAAIWSCPMAAMQEFPARSFLRFFLNHGLLDLVDRPQWRTVTGGSRNYVERMQDAIGEDRVHRGPVERIRREGNQWEVHQNGAARLFQRVVLACHADEALALIEDPPIPLARALRSFRFQRNRAVLHTDLRWLPRIPEVRSSWNYLARDTESGQREVCVSYWMNHLHRLTTRTPYIVTLNPWFEPHPTTIIAEREWHHPVFDREAMQAQEELAHLQGQDGLYVAGAWTGYGFHEDGIRSGLAVAQAMGLDDPWPRAPGTSPAAEGRSRR